MQGTDDLRHIEENESPRDESMERRLKYQMSNCESDGNNLEYTKEEYFNRVNANDTEHDNDFGEFQLGNTTYQEIESRGRNSMQRNKTIDAFPTEKHVHRKTSTDWSVGSASDGSVIDLTNSPEENFPIESLPDPSNNATETLRNQIRWWERQAEVSELELQSLRRQIGKESRRVQDLSRQIVSLREEKDRLGTECELLKSSQKTYIELAEEETQKLRVSLEELRRELKHEKTLNNTLCLQLQKTEDSNSELILAVKDLEKMLEQKDTEISHLSNKVKASQNVKDVMAEAYRSKMDREGDEQALTKHQKEHNHAKEADLLKHKIRDLNAEIEVNCRDKERLSLDYELSKQENIAISCKLEQSQIEQMKLQNEYSESLATIKEFRFQVERLEQKITTQALEFSQSLDSINDLESQVKSLEKELEKQGQHFEDDLEALTNAKVEQEQRAIRAEEALRKTRLSNANAAEHLQEEVRRLSLEITSKFDENEKLAMEATAEAHDLRLEIRALEDMLKKASKELLLTKDQYEQELQKILNQTNLQSKQIKQMSMELEEKHVQLKEYEDGNNKAFSIKNQTQEASIDRRKMEKNDYPDKKEPNGNLREKIKQMKTSVKESQQWAKQREELERELVSVRKEAEKIQEESVTWKTMNDEKDIIVGTLQSEMKRLRANYDELKQSVIEGKTEKEEGSQKKKEEAISSTDNKPALLPYSIKNAVSSPENLNFIKERTATPEVMNASTTESTLKQSRSAWVLGERTRGICSEEEQIASTCHCSDDFKNRNILSEVKSLNERNKQMEGELREMQEKYSEISLRFAEVEGERQQLVMTVRNLKNGKKK